MAVCGSLWQSLTVSFSFNFYKLYRPERTPHDPILAFLEPLEFVKILRLFKFEDIITMVRRSVGNATPPSVMALFALQRAECGQLQAHPPLFGACFFFHSDRFRGNLQP